MVMELLYGEDLNRRLRRGPLSVEDAVCHIIEACDAIGEAHELGIVHRDVKPANLFAARESRGRVFTKVLDFGISKMTAGSSDADTDLTNSHAQIGTVRYMAPEQLLSSRHVAAAADIWALGVTMYELLTGRLPFDGATRVEVAAQVLRDPAPPCRRFRAEIDAALEAAVLRCLEKEPLARFASVLDLVRAISGFAPARAAGIISHLLPPDARTRNEDAPTDRGAREARIETRDDSEASEHEDAPVERADREASVETGADPKGRGNTEKATTHSLPDRPPPGPAARPLHRRGSLMAFALVLLAASLALAGRYLSPPAAAPDRLPLAGSSTSPPPLPVPLLFGAAETVPSTVRSSAPAATGGPAPAGSVPPPRTVQTGSAAAPALDYQERLRAALPQSRPAPTAPLASATAAAPASASPGRGTSLGTRRPWGDYGPRK